MFDRISKSFSYILNFYVLSSITSYHTQMYRISPTRPHNLYPFDKNIPSKYNLF